MNANQLINMVVRMVMRQFINRGVRAGMDAASNQMAKRKRPAPDAPQVSDRQDPNRRG